MALLLSHAGLLVKSEECISWQGASLCIYLKLHRDNLFCCVTNKEAQT